MTQEELERIEDKVLAPMITKLGAREYDNRFYPLLRAVPKEIGFMIEARVNAFVDEVATAAYLAGRSHGHKDSHMGITL